MKQQRTWITEFLREARSLVEDLDSGERARLGDLDLSRPYQVRDYWVEPLNLHHLIITCFSDAPDDELKIIGPMDYPELYRTLSDDLEDSFWDREVTRSARRFEDPFGDGARRRKETFPLRQALYSNLSTFCHNVKAYAFSEERLPPGSGSRDPSPDGVLIQNIWGALEGIDPTEVARRKWEAEIHDARKPPYVPDLQTTGLAIPPKPDAPPAERDRPHGFWTYLYPAHLIGDPPERTLRGSTPHSRRPLDRPRDAFYWIGEELIAGKDGFIAVQNTRRDEAVRRLNLLAFALRLLGFECYAIHQQDFSWFRLSRADGSNQVFKARGSTDSPRVEAARSGQLTSTKAFGLGPDQISTDELERAYKMSRHLAESEFSQEYRLLLEAETLFAETRFTSAHLMAWGAIESEVRRAFEQEVLPHMEAEQPSPSEIPMARIENYLTEFDEWVVPDLHILEDVRDTRNDLAHGERRAGEVDAEAAIEYARQLLEPHLQKDLGAEAPNR